jgi:hypothetical protein
VFELLTSPADWDAFRARVAARLGLVEDRLACGQGPQAYPCLVASYDVVGGATPRVVMCYVYQGDADRLLCACPVAQERAPADRVPIAQPVVSAKAPADPQPGQDEFNRTTAANLLTLAWVAVETGFIKEKVYEQKFQEFLAMIDQLTAEDRDRLTRSQRAILDRRPSPG